jgi:transposase-like protein
MKILSEETKRELLRDYENKNITVEEIALKYGVGKAEVAKIAVEQGATPRREKTYGKSQVRKGKGKACPRCKKLTEVKGARFCCYCGADIRSNKEILAEKNEELLRVVCQLPENVRDFFRDVLLANIKELREEK